VPVGVACKVCSSGPPSCPTGECIGGQCRVVWPPCP
jgi:hypothetical protein